MHLTFGTNAEGYRTAHIGGKTHKVHCLIAQAFLSDWNPKLEVDHKFGDRADNRPSKLRMATRIQNGRGYNEARVNSTSQYRGVNRRNTNGKWQVRISSGGKTLNIGTFETEHEAALIWNDEAKKLGYPPEAMNSVCINAACVASTLRSDYPSAQPLLGWR